MSKTSPNMSAKSLLGKLLATENITVQQQPVHTAMFDVESRTLTLPLWDRMSNTLTDMLIGHEVGHAIFTPAGGDDLEQILESMDPSGRIPIEVRMDYLNVVEDARIERLMQRKFAGMKRDFKDGYADLVDRDFFGIEGRDLGEMQIIDRVNLHYKIGSMIEVPFTDEERSFIDMIDGCETFEQVVDAAVAMMEYADAQQRAEQQSDIGMPASTDGDGDEQGRADGDGSQDGETGNGGQTAGDDSTDGEGDAEGNASANGDTNGGDASGQCGLTRSETMKNLESNLKDDSIDHKTEIEWVSVPTNMDLSSVIIPHTEILKIYQQYMNGDRDVRVRRQFADFQKESAKIVSNMVKRFEMKKAADECKRAEQSQSGVLDPLKMINYRWEEDIFLKITEVQEGKSHGLVMFVDWSGSMSPNIVDTVKQTLVLTMFCQKVGIPYDVYAFTNCWNRQSFNPTAKQPIAKNPKVGDVDLFTGINFLNVLSSSCKRSDANTLAAGLLSVAYGNDYDNRGGHNFVPSGMGLSGTPLDDQILAARQILTDFKDKHGVQIVNAVFLTDGVSSSCTIACGAVWNGTEWISSTYKPRGLRASDGTLFNIGSGTMYRRNMTATLLQWLQYETGIPAIGIYLTDVKNGKYAIAAALGENDWRIEPTDRCIECEKRFLDNGAISIPNGGGYCEQIIMAAESKRKIKGLDDISVGAKATVVANAMIREAKKKKAFTKIMDIFVDRIAKEAV